MVFCPPLFSQIMVDRTQYRQQKTGKHQNTMIRKEEENNGGQNTI
jgi:hypothetical protein